MIQKIFIWTSPLPLLIFWGLSIYINQFEGWGQWAGGILLLGPVLLSLLMGVMGVVLIVGAKKRQEPVANLWVSTVMAVSLFLYFLAKGIALEFIKSFG
jgi:hypothetical protein